MKGFIGKIPSELKVILVIFVAFLGIAFLMTRETEEPEIIHFLSTFEESMYGASKIKTLAEKSGFDVDVNRTTFTDAALHDAGVVFILSPEYSIRRNEQNKLDSWVENGGILVYGFGVAEHIVGRTQRVG